MSIRSLVTRAAWLGAAASAALLLAASGSHACSVCLAGDPRFSSQGATAQQAGDLTLYFEARGWRKESGVLPHVSDEADHDHEEHGHAGAHDEHGGAHEAEGTERNRSQRLDLYVAWTPVDRLTFTLDVPWAFNTIHESEGGEHTRSTLAGLGDVSLAASGVLWRDREVLPSTWLEASAFLKAPTGRSRRRVDGVRDPHLQTGTGSWDFGFGLAATRRLGWGSLYASVAYRENTEGSLDYEFGDTWLANAALEVPLGHALRTPALDALTAGLEINYRYAGYDHAGGERYADSGGSIFYATPSLRVRLPWTLRERSPSLRLAVQLPLGSGGLHGRQREREVWSVGLLLPL